MTDALLDIRARNRAGIWRYGSNVISPLVERLHEQGINAHVIARNDDLSELRTRLPNHVPVTGIDAEFIRWRESQVHRLIERSRSAVYLTTNYSYDPTISVPVIPTVHDLTRVKWPELTFTSESFSEAFGARQAQSLRQASKYMQDHLAPCDTPPRFGDDFQDYFRLMNAWIAARAAHILTISNSSAHDIRTILGVDDNQLSITPCGVQAEFEVKPASAVRTVLADLQLPDRYLITVGQTSPGKRLDWLIEELLPVLSTDKVLVVVGEYALRHQRIRSLAEGSGATVRLLGRVSDATLASLYTGAASYVTASTAEGYGLPAQEALACGTSVICSDISVFRETLGGAASFFDPTRPELLRQEAARALDRGPRRSPSGLATRDWGTAADAIADVIVPVLGRDGRTLREPRGSDEFVGPAIPVGHPD